MIHTLKIGLISLVAAALATTGAALALDGDEEPLFATASEATEDEADFDTVDEVIVSRIFERLVPLVDEGEIDEDQARAVAEHLAGDCRDGLQSRLRPRPPRHGIPEDLAEFLGISPGEIREMLEQGSTLAEIAAASGKTADDLASFMLEPIEARLNDAVDEGRITEERRTEALDKARERIQRLIEADRPVFAEHRTPHRGRRGGSGGFGPPFGGGQHFPGPFHPHPWMPQPPSDVEPDGADASTGV
jgi:hypothetical protein